MGTWVIFYRQTSFLSIIYALPILASEWLSPTCGHSMVSRCFIALSDFIWCKSEKSSFSQEIGFPFIPTEKTCPDRTSIRPKQPQGATARMASSAAPVRRVTRRRLLGGSWSAPVVDLLSPKSINALLCCQKSKASGQILLGSPQKGSDGHNVTSLLGSSNKRYGPSFKNFRNTECT